MMEDYLVEAKQEYTSYLISVLIPSLTTGFRDIFEQAKKIHNGNSVYKNFQLLLENVPHWNNYMLEKEVADIVRETGCSWLDDLLTAVFVSHSKILASVKVGNFRPKNRKIDLKIPDTPNFVHQCYIQAARDFYKNPMLFVDDTAVVRPDDILKNQQMIQTIVKEAICTTIRKLLPFKDILTQYLALDLSAPIYIGGEAAATATATKPMAPPPPPPPPPLLLSLPSPPSPQPQPPPQPQQAPTTMDEDEDEDEEDDIAAKKAGGGKVLDFFDMEIPPITTPLPPQQQQQQQPHSRMFEAASMDSATVQQVVSNINKELKSGGANDNDDMSVTVGMTELQGVLNEGGTIDTTKFNKPKPFLPMTFKKQQQPSYATATTTSLHNNNHNKSSNNNNVKKIVVKYDMAAKKKKQKTTTTLIEDAAEADSSELAF